MNFGYDLNVLGITIINSALCFFLIRAPCKKEEPAKLNKRNNSKEGIKNVKYMIKYNFIKNI